MPRDYIFTFYLDLRLRVFLSHFVSLLYASTRWHWLKMYPRLAMNASRHKALEKYYWAGGYWWAKRGRKLLVWGSTSPKHLSKVWSSSDHIKPISLFSSQYVSYLPGQSFIIKNIFIIIIIIYYWYNYLK